MLTFLDINVTMYFKFSNLGVSGIGGWSGFFLGAGSGFLSGRVGNLVRGFLALFLGDFGFVPGGVGPIFSFACNPYSNV